MIMKIYIDSYLCWFQKALDLKTTENIWHKYNKSMKIYKNPCPATSAGMNPSLSSLVLT